MKNSFDDLLNLSPTPPLWFDENGAPRFVAFHPTHCPNIYNNQSFLLLIACQYCKKEFRVEISFGVFHEFRGEVNILHYGDPPAHGCVGDTMNCDDLRVIEAWDRTGKKREWSRKKKLEIEIK